MPLFDTSPEISIDEIIQCDRCMVLTLRSETGVCPSCERELACYT